jgi:CO dehydrogenase/acetyl-CoA synthase delta subunit
MSKHIYIGVIPDIFGYGISVASDTEAGAMKALRKAYADWKKARPNPETNFDKSFDAYAGRVIEVELGKAYYDNFNS